MNLVEKIKQHWKVILICLLATMWMSKCTTGCSQERTIKALNTELHHKDSVITEFCDDVDSLENELTLYKKLYDSEKSHNTDVSNISKMSIDELKVKVHTQANEIINLKRINDGLTKENSILHAQLDSTLRK
jgi:predicted RNase H-like nuclease (RuvC/YqgF family)